MREVDGKELDKFIKRSRERPLNRRGSSCMVGGN